MDKWVTVVKPNTLGRAKKPNDGKGKIERTYSPYDIHGRNSTLELERNSKRPATSLDGQDKPTNKVLTKYLLDTLADEDNPITHSDIGLRADHVSSTATGHQRGEGRGSRTVYLEDRSRKLVAQSEVPPRSARPLPMKGVRVYINGYLRDTTDIEIKRIVKLAGGEVMHTASGATHIVTSQQLSGSKTQKALTSKARNHVHVVTPDWITDSVDSGKRKVERHYSVLKDKTHDIKW